MKLYYDGNLVKENRVKVEEITPIFHTGAFILGQENDQLLYGGSFDAQQAFSGKMSQVEVWSKEVSSNDIKNMALCNIATLEDESKIISWEVEKWQKYEVDLVEVSLQSFCK